MSINYTSVIGVGVAEDDITYHSLTEQSKNIVKAEFRKIVDLEPEVFNGVLVW